MSSAMKGGAKYQFWNFFLFLLGRESIPCPSAGVDRQSTQPAMPVGWVHIALALSYTSHCGTLTSVCPEVRRANDSPVQKGSKWGDNGAVSHKFC